MAGASSTAAPGQGGGAAQMMGRYAPVARLGTGGMADVFLTLAHGPQGVNKLSVVKRLRDPENAAMTEMFLDEARLAARLNHPNIVHTYEVGEARGEYFIAMEYLEGQPLNQLMKKLESRCEGLPEPFLAFIAIQALKGLHYAHEFCDFDGTPLGVVHRDVSPHNLFVTYGGEIKLLDFGIAKAAVNMTHTEDGVLKGKIRYMAPEQATGVDVDRRVDIYAFGVVLWEMLARRSLFTGAPLSILTRIVNEEIPPVRGIRPDVSPTLEAIALKAVRRDRDERYATADEMRLDLEAYLRARTDVASERDLANMMNDMFAQIRDSVRAQIKAYVSTISLRGRLPTAPGITGTGSLPVLPGLSQPPSELSTSASSSLSSPSRPPPESSESLSTPPQLKRSRWPLVFIAIVPFVAVVGAGFFLLRAPKAAPVEPPPAVAQTSFAPTPSPASTAKPRVSVATSPSGAHIEWNGQIFGPTPTAFTIDPGSQTLRISRDGFEASVITLDVKLGDDVARTVTLRPSPVGDVPSAAAQAAGGAPGQPGHHVHSGGGGHVVASPPQTSPSPAPTPVPSASATQRPNIKMLDESESQ